MSALRFGQQEQEDTKQPPGDHQETAMRFTKPADKKPPRDPQEGSEANCFPQVLVDSGPRLDRKEQSAYK